MKTFGCSLLLLFAPTLTHSQPGIPRDIELALSRIESAFRNGDPEAVTDLFSSTWTTIRIGDSLYSDVSSIRAMEILRAFFDGKDSISFRFGLPGSGMLVFSAGGRRDTVPVDIFFHRSKFGPEVYALNISTYPTATMFLPYIRKR